MARKSLGRKKLGEMDESVSLKGWEPWVLGIGRREPKGMGEEQKHQELLPTFCEFLGSASSRHLLPEVPSQTKVSKRPCAAQTL